MQLIQYHGDDNFLIPVIWTEMTCECNSYTNVKYQCYYLIIILLKSILFKS